MIKCPARDSKNSKLGSNVRATYREVGPTCPSTCEHLKSKSCYAMYAFVNIHAKKSGYHPSDSEAIYDYLKGLPEGKAIRHHVSGDFLKPGDLIDDEYIDAVLKGHNERDDLEGWSYTHAWKRLDANRMNGAKSLTVNASCDSEEEVFQALEAGWPVTTVVPEDHQGGYISKEGKSARVVICPSQTNDLSCSECKLCWRKNRKAVVAFRVHGSGKAKF